MIKQKLLLKRLVEGVTSRLLKAAGVRGLVAGVASRLFWKYIVVPVVKHLHASGKISHGHDPGKTCHHDILVKHPEGTWYPIRDL